jgi:hypothetical protein
MHIQLDLFDTAEYNILPRLTNLRNSMRFGWRPFSIDSLEKAGKMYHILCDVIWKQYDVVMKENDYEQSCDNPDD